MNVTIKTNSGLFYIGVEKWVIPFLSIIKGQKDRLTEENYNKLVSKLYMLL